MENEEEPVIHSLPPLLRSGLFTEEVTGNGNAAERPLVVHPRIQFGFLPHKLTVRGLRPTKYGWELDLSLHWNKWNSVSGSFIQCDCVLLQLRSSAESFGWSLGQ